MTTRESIAWFKTTFQKRIAAGVCGTPLSVYRLVAIAQQETDSIWAPLVEKGRSENDVLRFSVGDTLDSDRGRRTFPKTKSRDFGQRFGWRQTGTLTKLQEAANLGGMALIFTTVASTVEWWKGAVR